MAYAIKHTCYYDKCGKSGTYQVIDRWNSSRGHFCRGHAAKELYRLFQIEQPALSPADLRKAVKEALE